MKFAKHSKKKKRELKKVQGSRDSSHMFIEPKTSYLSNIHYPE